MENPRLANATGEGAKHPDGGRFAGAVGPEKRKDLARVDFEVDAVYSHEIVIGFAQSGY